MGFFIAIFTIFAYMKLTIPNLLIVFSFALMVFGAMSCNTEKRATRILYKSVRIDEKPARDYCAKVYDPKDSINERIIYKHGATITDTVESVLVEVMQDTVYVNKIKTVTIAKTDTVTTTKYVQVENSAKIEALQATNQECEEDKVKAEQGLKTWRTISIIAILLIALWVVLKFVIGKFR